MKALGFALLLAGSALTPATAHAQVAKGGFEKIANGIGVVPSSGPAGWVEVTVHGDGIIHVVASPTRTTTAPSLMVPTPPIAGQYTVTQQGKRVLVATARDTAEVDLKTGRVRFLDKAGKVVLDQAASPTFFPTSADGKPFVVASQQFNRGTDEGLYGLGQHQNAQMDYNGEDVELAQHNMDIAVPFVVSTRNYGLLWDNDGITRFGNP
ncbi:MAG: DUF4968 domain-containing protein, partial [Sphingomonas sp.]